MRVREVVLGLLFGFFNLCLALQPVEIFDNIEWENSTKSTCKDWKPTVFIVTEILNTTQEINWAKLLDILPENKFMLEPVYHRSGHITQFKTDRTLGAAPLKANCMCDLLSKVTDRILEEHTSKGPTVMILLPINLKECVFRIELCRIAELKEKWRGTRLVFVGMGSDEFLQPLSAPFFSDNVSMAIPHYAQLDQDPTLDESGRAVARFELQRDLIRKLEPYFTGKQDCHLPVPLCYRLTGACSIVETAEDNQDLYELEVEAPTNCKRCTEENSIYFQPNAAENLDKTHKCKAPQKCEYCQCPPVIQINTTTDTNNVDPDIGGINRTGGGTGPVGAGLRTRNSTDVSTIHGGNGGQVNRGIGPIDPVGRLMPPDNSAISLNIPSLLLTLILFFSLSHCLG